MSNSSLVTVKVPAYEGNYTKGRTSKISEITIHHMSGKLTAQRCGEIFKAVGRCGSSHYGIGYDGEIGLYVNECDTAWTNSNWESNCRAVTIEVSNSKNKYPWPVSDKSLQSLIKLVADIAKRNNLGTLVKGKNLTWHRMYSNTDCPGDYLLSKMDYIITEANKIISAKPSQKPISNSDTVGHRYNGINIDRNTDYLVVYKNKPTTGTNKWGYEVAIDKNGVALTDPKYIGNTTIPVGGFVISGHGNSANWIYGNIKKGYYVTVNSDGNIYVDKWQHRSVDGINSGRGHNQLIVYNSGKSTGTNTYGYEVAIDKNGVALTDPKYVGNTAIPSGGFVVSGHLLNVSDSAGSWIYGNIKKGSHVYFNGKFVSVRRGK